MKKLDVSSIALDRRRFLQGSGAFAGLSALGLAGCDHKAKVMTGSAAMAPALPFYDVPGKIVPLRADEDRIFRVTVCTRPFRAAGPRLEVEKMNDRAVIHNYGHGGSGWSLSWGYAIRVAKLAQESANGEKEVAVVGAGALGLTSAIMLQRAGFKVTIYARDLAPYTRSSRATGTWTPDSRIAFADKAPAGFGDEWERIARDSFFYYQSFLGSPGTPIEWIDTYGVGGNPRAMREAAAKAAADAGEKEEHQWMRLFDRIADLTPHSHEMPEGSTPFPGHVVRGATLCFNVADYSRQLLSDFYMAGGKYEHRIFNTPQEIAALPYKVIVNCPGYEARKLWGDDTITPVRGQIQWLIPQEDAHYSIGYHGLNVVARRDGVVLQMYNGENYGFGEEDERPRAAETAQAMGILHELYGQMKA